MTEQEWLSSGSVAPLLEVFRSKADDRQRRLFVAACARGFWRLLTDERARMAVETGEQFADGLTTSAVLAIAAAQIAPASGEAWQAEQRLLQEFGKEPFAKAGAHAAMAAACAFDLARIVTANFTDWRYPATGLDELVRASTAACWARYYDVNAPRQAPLDAGEQRRQSRLLRCILGNPFSPVTLDRAWFTASVTTLARTAYDERLMPGGELDPKHLSALAVALTDAGCDDAQILDHCLSPGPHVRGCWVVDLLLGKG